MTHPASLSVVDPDTGLMPHEAVCPVHNLAYHRHLPECPDCKDARQ